MTITAHEVPLLPPQPEEFSLPAYEQGLHDNGVRTGRHAAENAVAPPDEHIKLATVAIRQAIAPAFKAESATPHSEHPDQAAMKAQYWQRAGRVGTEHGARAGYELDDYFATSETRSYFSLKQEFEARNPEGSLGRGLLNAIDAYHKDLQINPAHAATIVCELVGKGRGEISVLAARHADVAPEEATRLAFGEFIQATVNPHIARIVEEFGTGEAVTKALTKHAFYPEFDSSEGAPLAVTKDDVRAFVDISDLQNRPYSRAELRMGDEIAKLPAMQMAMLGVHERLIGLSQSYLAKHPERMTGDMASWSEIFVPERQADGTTELLPNPKLMRAVSNNVLPAVAGKLLKRGVDIDEITADDIVAGVEVASRTYKLLQSKVGLFRTDPQTGRIELGNVTTVICPANQLFPNFLRQYLGADYEQLKRLKLGGVDRSS